MAMTDADPGEVFVAGSTAAAPGYSPGEQPPKASAVVKAIRPVESDSDDDAGQTPEQKKVFKALDKVLDEWLMKGLPRAGAQKFIRVKVANGDDESCARVRRWMLLRMNGKLWMHGVPLMCHTPENIPDLRAMHTWPREALPWMKEVEKHHGKILEELLSVRAESSQGQRSGFQPYRDPEKGFKSDIKAVDGVGIEGVDTGAWNVLYLYLNHKRFEENCVRFPETLKAIEEAFPRQYSHAFFSALTPGSHIMKHHGPSNRMLRCWLPICGLEGFKLRVGDTIVEPKAGEAFAWDHSFEHEAWHEGPETRVVLIVDIWHPDLSDAEVGFLRTMQNCRLRAGKALVDQAQADLAEAQARGEAGAEDNFSTYFDVIEKAKNLLTDDDWWVINAERDPTTKPT